LPPKEGKSNYLAHSNFPIGCVNTLLTICHFGCNISLSCNCNTDGNPCQA